MLTEFGKIIRNLCTNTNLKQEELAADLGISAATLSNYMNGIAVPKMDFLLKCIKHFNISNKSIKDFLTKAFKSSGINNRKIILDTQFLSEERFNLLVQIIIVLLCNNKDSSNSNIKEKFPLNLECDLYQLQEAIKECYKRL